MTADPARWARPAGDAGACRFWGVGPTEHELARGGPTRRQSGTTATAAISSLRRGAVPSRTTQN